MNHTIKFEIEVDDVELKVLLENLIWAQATAKYIQPVVSRMNFIILKAVENESIQRLPNYERVVKRAHDLMNGVSDSDIARLFDVASEIDKEAKERVAANRSDEPHQA